MQEILKNKQCINNKMYLYIDTSEFKTKNNIKRKIIYIKIKTLHVQKLNTNNKMNNLMVIKCISTKK